MTYLSFIQTALLIGLVTCSIYVLYRVKVRLGIDVFPRWGLHLPGPRSIGRKIVRWGKSIADR